MIGRKLDNDGCILRINRGNSPIVLMPNGRPVPGQIKVKYVEGSSYLVQAEMEIYICGFNKSNVEDRKTCYISDDQLPFLNLGEAINGTYIRVVLPDGTYLPGERNLKIAITANDQEIVTATVLLFVSDVVDERGDSILVEPGGGSIGESI